MELKGKTNVKAFREMAWQFLKDLDDDFIIDFDLATVNDIQDLDTIERNRVYINKIRKTCKANECTLCPSWDSCNGFMDEITDIVPEDITNVDREIILNNKGKDILFEKQFGKV